MPLLSFSNPRNRATLIAALLLMEFMAILYLRESGPRDASAWGAKTATLFNSASTHDRYPVQDDLQYRQQQQHHRGQVRHEEGGYRDAAARAAAEAIQMGDPVIVLRARGTAGSNTGAGESKKQRAKPGRHQHQVHHHVHVQSPPETGVESNQSSTEPIKRPSITQPSTTKDDETRRSSKINNKKQKKSTSKSINKHRAQEKNRRGGFKSTEERKLAQLIPALDENGVIIEDHFISPRDSDGDGIPDYYVLLRPTENSKYMMDVGLFDDEIVQPAPAVLSSVIATPIVATTTAPGRSADVVAAVPTTSLVPVPVPVPAPVIAPDAASPTETSSSAPTMPSSQEVRI
ncbi:hypothetical protein EDD21DRAFT_445476 [Dissophora ornata]|nr:hypothetical protein EDD21DRAFT_445476 [Dissophora ornata]